MVISPAKASSAESQGQYKGSCCICLLPTKSKEISCNENDESVLVHSGDFAMKIIRSLALSLLMCMAVSAMADTSHLSMNDVQQIMQQILREHVDQHDLSSAIMQRSVQIYLDQADPDRIYLLQAEADPLLQMSDQSIAQLMAQYKKGDYSFFRTLDEQLQSSMRRARELRQGYEKDLPALFAEAKNSLSVGSDKKPSAWDQYASSLAELEKRQKEKLINFINMQMDRFGVDPVMVKQKLIAKRYEEAMRSSEDKYLFENAGSQTLSAPDQEHLFALHLLKALSKSLDAHTTVFNDSEAEDMRTRLEKGFKGIGIELVEDLEGYSIKGVIKGAPAEKSGQIEVKDQLLAVDGTSVEEMTLQEVVLAIRGDGKAESATLTLKRGVAKPFDVALKREQIVMQDSRAKTSYEAYENGIVGTISLDTFYEGENGVSAAQDVSKALRELKSKGKLLGLVLDLRNNPGGYLTQAVKVAGLFITDGVVVVSKYSDGEKQYYRDLDSNAYFTGPLVILTSRLTASAAEIVTQALRDYGVALVVGDDRTYGKGTIQAQTVTDTGASSYFKVTVGEYFTPSGRSPQLAGVKSDVLLAGPYSKTKVGEKYLEHPIPADKIDPSFNDELKDVDTKSKGWFLKYYLPNLQSRVTVWERMIPQLALKSDARQKSDQRYQTYLKELTGEQSEASQTSFNVEDYRLKEALNIVKDMVVLQSQGAAGYIGPAHIEAKQSIGR